MQPTNRQAFSYTLVTVLFIYNVKEKYTYNITHWTKCMNSLIIARLHRFYVLTWPSELFRSGDAPLKVVWKVVKQKSVMSVHLYEHHQHQRMYSFPHG